jgi:hypothetical protein
MCASPTKWWAVGAGFKPAPTWRTLGSAPTENSTKPPLTLIGLHRYNMLILLKLLWYRVLLPDSVSFFIQFCCLTLL